MNEDINQEILSELRKLRRASQISVWLCLVALAVLAAYFAFVRPQLLRLRSARDVQSHYTQQSSAAAVDSDDAWSRIQAYLDRGEYSTALSMARAMTNRAPTDQFP